MTNPTDDQIIERAAKAMADDWNPERDPVLTAMFRDYAATALEAVAPLIAAQALRETANDDELWRLTEGEQRLRDASTPYYEGVAYGFRIARSLLKDHAARITGASQLNEGEKP